MLELVDRADSKSVDGNIMWVQVPSGTSLFVKKGGLVKNKIKLITNLLCGLCFVAPLNVKAETTAQTEAEIQNPVPVIFDADMSTDVDDLIAAKILMNYDREGIIDLKAIMVSVNNSKGMAPKAAGGLLSAYGFNDVSVGFTNSIIEDRDILPYWGYLSSLNNGMNPKDTAVRQYRKILASCHGEKVVIVVTGYFNNIYDLMKSQPDDISPYNGEYLIQQNVAFFDVTGQGKGKPNKNWATGFENNTRYYPYAYVSACNFYRELGMLGVPIYQYNEDGTMAGNIYVGGYQHLPQGDPILKCYEGAQRADTGGPGWDAIAAWLVKPLIQDTLSDYGITKEKWKIESTSERGKYFYSTPDENGNVTILNMNLGTKAYNRYIQEAY